MKKNCSLMLPITNNTTERNASSWLRIIRYRESGIVIQLQDDCEYRVPQVIENAYFLRKYLGLYYRKYLLAYVPVDNLSWEKAVKNALIDLTRKRKIREDQKLNKMGIEEILTFIGDRGFEVGLFLTRLTRFLDRKHIRSFLELEYLLEQCKNFSVILFLEKDVVRPEYRLIVDKCSLLFDHLLYYPLYEDYDVHHFIRYYDKLWAHKLSKEKEDAIVKACGGYLWLVSQAHKHLRDNQNDTVDDALGNGLMLQKLSIVWEKFTPKEKRILQNIAKGIISLQDKETAEYLYLQKIHIIRQQGPTDVLGVPLLKKVIDYEEALQDLHADKGQIIRGDENITPQFAHKERKLMSLLLIRKKKLVKRADVAHALWGKNWEECYSDWAIDKLVSRLRKKLISFGIDKKLLRTIKKKGFIYG